MKRCGYGSQISSCLLLLLTLAGAAIAQAGVLKGRVTDPQGNATPSASVRLVGHGVHNDGRVLGQTTTGSDGKFELTVYSTGKFDIKVEAEGFQPVASVVTVGPNRAPEITLSLTELATRMESVTVTADVNHTDIVSPDPGEKVFVRQDLLDANPGRPGAPVSIPGYPIETASSGIKAPQYFAPGVAGDHGETIAQYIALGSYLVPNNLSANAHGNGYSDPNLLIPDALESVQIDGGAFNVREGNHAVSLAATYGLRSNLDPFLTVTSDYRDISLVTGFSPSPNSFVALSTAYGNGFLDRLEHRQQYKFNAERIFQLGEHRLSLLGIGYYGASYVPGLIPIYVANADDAKFPNLGDTIDPRQHDQTHTGLVALNDIWQLNGSQQLQFSGFFRTYNLSLISNFGQGLIRQSEFRTVAGGSTNYVNKLSESISLLGGLEYEREAPRRDDLDHYTAPFDANKPGYYGPFTRVDGNDVTLGSVAPYIAVNGALTRYFRYYLGWRRDAISVDNEDLLHPQNSFHRLWGVNSPKATISFLPKESWYVPLISLSFGQSFFTSDPRIGTGSAAGTPISNAHSYQLVASKTVLHTDVKLTLGHVTKSQTLAKLDPDTGLQFDEGPSRLRFLSLAVRRTFSLGSLQASISKADARDLDSGQPTPEAPRTIFDVLGAIQKLPLHVQARGEYEYVAAKPLGTGCNPNPNEECTGVPVKEFRVAIVRPFLDNRLETGVNFLVARGYTGQTTQNFGSDPIPEVVGVRIPSYASVGLTYRFGGSAAR
jgi:Carboxypeptidase regulatory-like domain